MPTQTTRRLVLPIVAGDLTCAAEPGVFCTHVVTQAFGTKYLCRLFEPDRLLEEQDGWLRRWPACIASEVTGVASPPAKCCLHCYNTEGRCESVVYEVDGGDGGVLALWTWAVRQYERPGFSFGVKLSTWNEGKWVSVPFFDKPPQVKSKDKPFILSGYKDSL